MPQSTLDEELGKYAIGSKIRGLRLRKKLGLIQLGRHTGLSPGLLSKIERGRLVPTLPTLTRIALVFNVGLEFFFVRAEEPAIAVIRRKERLRFPEQPDSAEIAYYFECLDFRAAIRKFNVCYAVFTATHRKSAHQHDGCEFLYLLSGILRMEIEHKAHRLAAGDAICFDSRLMHSYQVEGKTKCAALVVTAP